MKDPAGNAAPSGGFSNGGWYSGYQYYNGTFAPQAGVINSNSPQQGAGQAVSQEVNRQTSVAAGLDPNANQNYVDKQNQAGVQNPNANFAPSGGGTGGAGGGGSLDLSGFAGGGAAASLNLPDLYNSLSKSAGIDSIEQSLTSKQAAYDKQVSITNNDPWLSEGDRTGRLQKLTTDYNNDIKNEQDSLAMKKADIQTQIDLQTKQFDINSQTAKAALDQFNMLLSSGALAGASGNDIAAITKATGISSSEIQAAINSQTQKDTPTSVQTVDDGKNIYSVVINTKTGAIISKSVLSSSKPTSSSTGGSPGSAQYLSSAISAISPQIISKLNSYGDISPADWNKALAAWQGAGLSQKDFVANFGQYADVNRGDFLSAYGFANPKTASTIKQNQAVNSAPQ